MKKPLFVVICLFLCILLSPAVKAAPDSPAVTITPKTIQKTGYVDIYITAAADGTTLESPIKVKLGTTEWVLQRGGSDVSITLPDTGDQVRIRFGAGGQAQFGTTEAGSTAISTNPASGDFSWSPSPPSLLNQGTYYFTLSGKEELTYHFNVEDSFFVVPEVPFGVVAALGASLAGLGFKRLRRKY